MERLPTLPFVGLCWLAACTQQQSAGPALLPAPLPTFAIGAAYGFDDGRTERVVATAGDSVRWHGAGDFVFTTTRNVLLPRLAWDDPEASGRRTMSIASGALFPLVRGNSVSFQTVRRATEHVGGSVSEVREDWQCGVDGTAQTTTPAGSFDTYRVTCMMATVPPGPTLTRAIFYAPAIDYYVRREDHTSTGETATITLTTYLSPEPSFAPQAERARAVARQTALETIASDGMLPWRDEATAIVGTVRPVSTNQSPRCGWCRTYEETIEANAHRYRMERIACRTRGGIWQVVGDSASSR